ncbi:MAG: tetratricopeptide repeat protein, partial [Acidobacteriota bacterium]
MQIRVSRRVLISLFPVLLLRAGLEAETWRVPEDFPTIKGAVLAARPGDTVDVADGYYFEHNIIIDKNLTLRARNPFRAIVYGVEGTKEAEAIFVVRAEAAIEGFILKNGPIGIVQRESPDVAWTARNMVILNMSAAAVAINAVEGNIGRGTLSNIIVDKCGSGFVTNDAFSMEVRNCLVANCDYAFAGFDHRSFFVDQAMIWNCRSAFSEAPDPLPPPQNSTIVRGEAVVMLNSLLSAKKNVGHKELLSEGLLKSSPEEARREFYENVPRGLVLAIAGDVYCQLQDYSRSCPFYEGALRLGYRTGSEEVIWRAHAGLAAVSARLEKTDLALEHYRKALQVLENLRGKLPLRFDNAGFFVDKLKVYLSLIRLLYEKHRRDPEQRYLEEAFLIAEKSRARGLSDRLEEAEIQLTATLPPHMAGEAERIAARISRLQVRLQLEELTTDERDRFLRELENSENAHRDFLIRLRREAPAYAERHYPEPLGYPQIREKVLAEDT